MLKLIIPSIELYDEDTNTFIMTKMVELQLEHSLVSLARWEAIWHKPFLSKDKKTKLETIDYIRCMTLTQNVDQSVYNFLRDNELDIVNAYIDDSMTATTIKEKTNTPSREIITAEIIYYWMITFNIPVEFHKWHLNRLLTLINVCNIKNQPNKKGTKKDSLAQRAALNEARLLQHKTTG